MRVFVTGATGFIGSAVVKDLLAAGHRVLGLCRDPAKTAALQATGAQVHSGSLTDLDSLKGGLAQTDGVIHLAFSHDFSKFAENCEDERRAIEALGSVLDGRPMVVTSGTAIANPGPGRPALESLKVVTPDAHPRALGEAMVDRLVASGANISVVRLPQVHDTRRQGLITPAILTYREKGVCAYIGDGANRWPAAHVLDVAPVYRLALERAERGARYHAVAEEGIAMRDIVGVLARRLNLPAKSISAAEAPGFFGWLDMFAGSDMPASSAETRKKLGWQPTRRGLLADLAELDIASLG